MILPVCSTTLICTRSPPSCFQASYLTISGAGRQGGVIGEMKPPLYYVIRCAFLCYDQIINNNVK